MSGALSIDIPSDKKYPECCEQSELRVEHNDAKDRKRKCCLFYVGSVKDLISQKIERLVNNDVSFLRSISLASLKAAAHNEAAWPSG